MRWICSESVERCDGHAVSILGAHAVSRPVAHPCWLWACNERAGARRGARPSSTCLPQWACGLSSTCFPDGPADSRAHASPMGMRSIPLEHMLRSPCESMHMQCGIPFEPMQDGASSLMPEERRVRRGGCGMGAPRRPSRPLRYFAEAPRAALVAVAAAGLGGLHTPPLHAEHAGARGLLYALWRMRPSHGVGAPAAR